MTATQSFKIYEVLQKHHKNHLNINDAFVEILELFDNKFEKEKRQIIKSEIEKQENLIFLQTQLESYKKMGRVLRFSILISLALTFIILILIKVLS